MSNQLNLLSLVIPMYNEDGNVQALYDALVPVLDELIFDCEIVFVDDGSQDRSTELVRRLNSGDARVKLVSLSRNFGTQMAIVAGLEHARGAAVVVMDADLQHPPRLILDLVEQWKDGYEVVFAVRKETQDAGWFKRLTSSAFAKLFNTLVDLKVDLNACDFRLMDRKVVDYVVAMRERNRFFRGLVTWVGFRQIGVPYVAAARHSGQTKYRLRRLISLALDAMTSFSTAPLRLCTYFGFLSALTVAPYAFWAIYVRLFTDTFVPGWAALIVAVLFLGGIQLISVGILGEYVGRIYDEVKKRPLYIPRERIGFEDDSAGLGRSSHRRDASIVHVAPGHAETPIPSSVNL